ncbi:hypothetical protein HYDPIDRAFT_23874 [Hydnomerulius pinastri MD-312]|nr:hypothetical protein HYDPIDRAFT_23874 [Hydnomerulius pinastri MD-312]
MNGFTSLPYAPPPGTAVPPWAYMSISGSDTWNAIVAYQNATTTNSVNSGTSRSTSTIAISSASPTSTSSGSHPDVWETAVAGSVGGVVGLLAIAGVIIFCLRRRFRNAGRYRPGQLGQATELNMTDPKYVFNFEPTDYGAPPQLPRLYNPDDPTTFPVPSSPTIHTTNTHIARSTTSSASYGRSRGHSDSPEV